MSMPSNESDSREAKAAKIAANPSGYKVCEGCDSIVGSSVVLCPNCHSYRFDPAPDVVRRQALALGSREQTSVTAGDLT
ncbi:hypothetical protein [Luteolibacter marinus]|uniref:hypothetical protein n=1 Tax=Luteolibacter marinus TaxID=2776705 RepID=UPI0018676E07|nr:hypothetical protein [Luteolibacter marinus]